MCVSKLGNLPPLPQISQTKCIIDIENVPLNINNQPSSSSSSPIQVDSLHRGPTYRFPCQSKCAANSSSNQGHPRLVKSAPRPCPVLPAGHFGVSPWDDLLPSMKQWLVYTGGDPWLIINLISFPVGSSEIPYAKLNNLFFFHSSTDIWTCRVDIIVTIHRISC